MDINYACNELYYCSNSVLALWAGRSLQQGPVGGQGPRGMGPGTPAGYGRGEKSMKAQTKNPILDVISRLSFQFVFCLFLFR